MSIDYVLHWTDDALKQPFKLSAQSTNITATSLVLSGKGSADWGEAIQQNMIRLLENFCSDNKPPPQPTAGQLWFNSAQQILKCYWNGRWNDVGYHRIDHTHPPAPPNFSGDLWYDLTNDVLKVFNGSSWDKVYQGGLPKPDIIPVPTPASPLPVPSPAGPVTPTPLPPGVPTPSPVVPTVPTPVVPTAPTPVPTVPTPISPTPTPVFVPTPVPATPAPTPTAPTPVPTVPIPTSPAPTPVAPPTPTQLPTPFGKTTGTWTLMFRDEFDTNQLNTGLWRDTAWNGTGNAILNYSVSSGALRIWSASDRANRWINTDGKFTMSSGYIEIEAKLPVGKGLWPAFWLMSHADDQRPEINLMEAFSSGPEPEWSVNQRPMNYSMILRKANSSYTYDDVVHFKTMNQMAPGLRQDLSAAFHKYAMNWDSTGVEFFFDGNSLGRWNDDGTGYFSRSLFLTIGLLHGSRSGLPDASTPTSPSNALEVNYVRIWYAQPVVATGPTTTPEGMPGPVGQDGSKYMMDWYDEFDVTTAPNPAFWNSTLWYESYNPPVNYAQGTAPNINNVLKIWPQRDNAGNFYDRNLNTDGKRYFLHGYMEIKAKLPKGKGLSPSAWLYTREIDPYGVSIRPEIDIFEAYCSGGIDNGWSDQYFNPGSYQVAVWKGPNSYDIAGQRQIYGQGLLNSYYKTYGVKWEPSRVTFYIDGQQVHAIDVVLDTRMFLVLSLQMGTLNSLGGAPDGTTQTGIMNSFEIEYVRYWKFR